MSDSAKPNAAAPWIYGPWLDMLAGCGAWSAPLLLLIAVLSSAHERAWATAFYLLAVVFNYPHFMATVYRAYHTRKEFSKYRIFTVYITLLLAATAILAHASFRLLPWVFTLYICWSPWHYTGQNFGLLMMFVRRNGISISPGERYLLFFSFIASYAMLMVGFHTGPSSDPLILSLGLSAKVSLAARIVLGGAFAVLGGIAFARLARRSGLRPLLAPITLQLTQFLWFVLPAVLELGYGVQLPQTRYSSGILAILHSVQYLWITSYYARREATAAGNAGWRMSTYFATLLAGGIALFIPGPWLVSFAFHYDFTSSFLIFTALVNIHHFILDGAIWKLRDSRIAALLLDRSAREPAAARDAESALMSATRWLAGRTRSAHAFRVALALLLFLWGGVDQVHNFLATDEQDIARLSRAARLNPYDATLQMRIARAATQAGEKDKAADALLQAIAANPANPAPQHARARTLLEQRRYAEAYEHYRRMLERFPRDPDALVNFALLSNQMGHPEQAIDSLQTAVDVNPTQVNAQLYLAEALDKQGSPAAAVRHYRAYLELVAAHPKENAAERDKVLAAIIEMADAYVRANQTTQAREAFESAISLGEKAGNRKLQSLALAHLGELQEESGDAAAAAHSYQRGLALDAAAGDPRITALDWFNYGQFLLRQRQAERLAFACFLHAQELLGASPGEEMKTVMDTRQKMEARLGREAFAVRKNLPALLAEASALPAASFTRQR
jgi:tetratricopeptide (TPR) repeat protein